MTRYDIITNENYKTQIETIFNKVENNAKASAHQYGQAYVLICGYDAIYRFKNDYLDNDAFIEETSAPRTDGKCSAELIPYICTNVYCDMRDTNAKSHFSGSRYFSIDWLIKWGGEYYKLFDRRQKTSKLYIYDDPRKYWDYLPYNWDDMNPEPNQIGVLSDKKIIAWVEFINKKISAYNAIKDERENGVSAFLKKVRNFDLTGVTDYEITDRRGHITKNGLRFSYQINDHGNINTELKVYTNCGDYDYLANFALMSAGKYQSK